MAEEIKSNEMSTKDTETAKEDIHQKPRNIDGAEIVCSREKLGDRALQVDYFDERDSGTPRTDVGYFKDQESSKSDRSSDEFMLGRKGVASISCQTDENANFIITSSEPKMDVEGLETNKEEVNILPVPEKLAKMTQNSFCQTDTSYEWPRNDEERKDQGSCKEHTYRKGTPEVKSKTVDTISIDGSSEKEKVDPSTQLTEVEKTSDDRGFDEGNEKSNEGQLKILKPEIHASGDKHEEGGEGAKIVKNVTGKEIILMEIADAVQLQQENPGNTFVTDAAFPIEDEELLHKSWKTEVANSNETSETKREQKDNHESVQKITADETLDGDIILDNIQKANEASAHLIIASRSGEFLKEAHSVRDVGAVEAEQIVKSEVNYCEESAPHEMYDAKVKENFENEGGQSGSITEFVHSEEFSQSENACDKSDAHSVSSESKVTEEDTKETVSHNVKFGNGDLKELLLSSNEKLDFEDCNAESKMKNSPTDCDSDEKAPARLEITTTRKVDMQGIEEKKSTMEDNNNNELIEEEKESKGIDDVQENLLQPEKALLAMEVKEDFYEGPSKDIKKNLNETSAKTNEVGGEKHSDITGTQEIPIAGCLVVKDYESKTNADGMSETTKTRNLIELSNLSNAPCLENEEQTVKFDHSEDVDTEDVTWQTASSQDEVADLEMKMREIYSPAEKEGGVCEIALQDTLESASLVNNESQEELDGNNLLKCEGDNEDSYKTTYSIKNEPCFADTTTIDRSREESLEKANENQIMAGAMRENGNQLFSDNIMDNEEVQKLIGDATSSIETEMKQELTNKEGHLEGEKENETFKESKENEYEVIERLIPGDGAESESIREAVIIRNREKERNERPLSIGEARVISPKHLRQVHFEKTEDHETSSEAIEKEAAVGDDSVDRKAMNILSPSQHLTFDMTNTPFFDSSVDGESCSPSGASVESEFSLALKEKDKLQKALTTVKHQYEDLLKEFDKIIESNTKEDNNNNNENVPISKENYNIALKCKEELEMEIRKAREQLAIVQAAHDSLSEELTWHSSEYECSEDSESVSFDFDENREESRWTSTPLPYDASLTNEAPKYVHRKNNSVQTDDESLSEYKDTEGRKPVLQERGTNTSPESEAGTTTMAYGAHDVSAIRSSELERLPATLPRRRGSKRRSRTLQFDELMQSDGKWVSRKSLVDKEQAKKSEKLTLQAIENAELKKELLLTKLEKIRLEAMLSCVMMRVSNTDVEDGFKKISLNSITSSTSTLRSTTSLTNIAQNDPSSPVRISSTVLYVYPFGKLLNKSPRLAQFAKLVFIS